MANQNLASQCEVFNQITEAQLVSATNAFVDAFVRGCTPTFVEQTRLKACIAVYCTHIRNTGDEPRMYADVYEPVAKAEGLYAELIRRPVSTCIRRAWYRIHPNLFHSDFWTLTFTGAYTRKPPVNNVFMHMAACAVEAFIKEDMLNGNEK
ncbi:MAG: hypothetical protein IJ421_00090 [Prevotella sp.]|nr:hypothetical protein [Prevotella sp.]